MYDPETEGIQMAFAMVISSIMGVIYVLIELLPGGIVTMCLAWSIETKSVESFSIGALVTAGLILTYTLDLKVRNLIELMKRPGPIALGLMFISALSVIVMATVIISLISA